MRRVVAPLLLIALVSSACADDRVFLGYQLHEGRLLEYRLALRADVLRGLPEQARRQQVEATFRALQEVLEPLPDGGTLARMSLLPRSLVVNGEQVAPGPEQEFLVALGPDGRVVEIRESAGDPTESLAGVGLERLLPRLRPVLPDAPVGTGDRWQADAEFTDESGSFSLTSRSRLDRLAVLDGHRAALVRTTYESPVDRREVFANAVADMVGRDVGVQEAWFSLEGFLLQATGDSVGRYRAVFRPPGGETGLDPVEGSLEVRLHTEMELVATPQS